MLKRDAEWTVRYQKGEQAIRIRLPVGDKLMTRTAAARLGRSLVLWLAFLTLTSAEDGARYPTVRPLSVNVEVPDVRTADLVQFISSPDGTALYKLQCHSAGFTGDADFDYSGDFECRLSSVGHWDSYSTLLTEDAHQSRDWETRARFFASELRTPCAQIPDFGTKRTFRLRRMALTLRVLDPVFSEGGTLRSLRLLVDVRPDNSATRPISEHVPAPTTQKDGRCKVLHVPSK